MTKRNNLPILSEQELFFNEVFSEFFKDKESQSKSAIINCDIEEVDDHLLFTMDIPGVKKEDIKVEVKKGNLVVTAFRGHQTERSEGRYLRKERSFGEFYRSFALSDDINTEAIEASYEEGVLHLAIPKKEEVKPKLIDIKSEKTSLLGKLIS